MSINNPCFLREFAEIHKKTPASGYLRVFKMTLQLPSNREVFFKAERNRQFCTECFQGKCPNKRIVCR